MSVKKEQGQVTLVLLITLLVFSTTVSEIIELPPDSTFRWEELVPFFADRLEEEYGSRARKYAPWVLEAAYRYDVDAATLARLIFRESSFRDNARSNHGAIGPAQIKPRYWEKFCGAHNIREPRGNVMCSAQILAHLEDRYGNMELALAHYNAGSSLRATPGYINFILGANS